MHENATTLLGLKPNFIEKEIKRMKIIVEKKQNKAEIEKKQTNFKKRKTRGFYRLILLSSTSPVANLQKHGLLFSTRNRK